MFCPGCGLEDSHANQFCRSCGADLNTIRTALTRPDQITASAASARDEIGRAVAAKIREARSPAELATVAEEVLPEIEKFLESPEERRLRRMRTGTIISSVGLGAAIGISVIAGFMKDDEIIFLAGLGIVAFFIGLGFVLNGIFLSVPRGHIATRPEKERELTGATAFTSELKLPESHPEASLFSSVTENTTRHLHEKKPASHE